MLVPPPFSRALESVARAVVRQARSRFPSLLRKVGLPVGVYDSIEDWIREAGARLIVLNPAEHKETVAAAPRSLAGQGHPAFPGHLVYSDIRTFVATIKGGRVTGRNGYIVDGTGKIIGDVPRVYRASYRPQSHPLLSQLWPPVVESLPGLSAALAIFSVGNYYHWMFEGLPRLEILRQAGFDLNKIDWFIVNETNNQFVQQSLAQFGIPPEKLRVCRDGHAWQTETLLVPSMPGRTNPSRWICEFLRKHFLPAARGNSTRRIFVSRPATARRRLVNEREVEEVLTRRGFHKVYLESLSLMDQIALFAAAKAVVGLHGASMANLVFCAPTTTVIELFNPDYVNACYWGVARQVNLDYGYVLAGGEYAGTIQDPRNCGTDLEIVPEELERMLDTFDL